jgi:hypothetical protein
MNRWIYFLFFFLFSCMQREGAPSQRIYPRSETSPLLQEISEFTRFIAPLSSPSPNSYKSLFKNIGKICQLSLATTGEFMGYPQYIYLNSSYHCIWNHSKELISFEKFDVEGSLRYRSYWYLGFPTLLEKKSDQSKSLLVNWKWVQNQRITTPTLLRMVSQDLIEKKRMEYLFNQYSGVFVSKEEWKEVNSKKSLNSWQVQYDEKGEPICSYYEANVRKNTKNICTLRNPIFEELDVFRFD